MSKNDVIAKFNSLFRAALDLPAGSAQNYYGSVSGSPHSNISTHSDLGQRNEPVKVVTDIPAQADRGAFLSTTIFNVLHNFAMEFTRVRQARWIYIVNATTFSEDPNYKLTALQPRFALYFPVPEHPLPGTVVQDHDIDDFLQDLLYQVDQRRASTSYGHIYAVCYSAAPPPCHASRGRR